MWGETHGTSANTSASPISIHSPRVGRDRDPRRGHRRHPISIHSPRVGRDSSTSPHPTLFIQFQSTRPVWGETRFSSFTGFCVGYFNPLAPCGARRTSRQACNKTILFQSTRPVWGETPRIRHGEAGAGVFQSTRPVWGETAKLHIFTAANCTILHDQPLMHG